MFSQQLQTQELLSVIFIKNQKSSFRIGVKRCRGPFLRLAPKQTVQGCNDAAEPLAISIIMTDSKAKSCLPQATPEGRDSLSFGHLALGSRTNTFD